MVWYTEYELEAAEADAGAILKDGRIFPADGLLANHSGVAHLAAALLLHLKASEGATVNHCRLQYEWAG